MMRLSGFALTGLLAFGVASPSWAYVIIGGPFNGVQVGDADPIEAQGPTIAGGEAGELSFVNGALGTSFVGLVKSVGVAWYDTDTDGVIAFQLATEPEYFLLGNGEAAVLMRNVANSNWGVLDISPVLNNLGLDATMQLAYVSEFGQFSTEPPTEPPVDVSEPGTLLLLGTGIALLGFRRRRTS